MRARSFAKSARHTGVNPPTAIRKIKIKRATSTNPTGSAIFHKPAARLRGIKI
jgi:hypothetical protein